MVLVKLWELCTEKSTRRIGLGSIHENRRMAELVVVDYTERRHFTGSSALIPPSPVFGAHNGENIRSYRLS